MTKFEKEKGEPLEERKDNSFLKWRDL